MENNTKWRGRFLTIAIGQAISLIGSSAVQFALIWWLAEQTASPMIMGVAGLAAYLPMAFLSPFAGVAADKYSRKIICITADLSMGLAALTAAFLLNAITFPIWAVLVILFVRGIGGTFHQPAIQSIIPQLVPAEELVRVNGWMQLMTAGSFILGPVIGAALYAALPMSLVLLTDVIGAIFASAALAAVKIPRLENHERHKVGFFAHFKEGIQVYREDKKLLTLIIAEVLCMLFFAPLSTFYPLMTSDYFDLSAMYGSIVEVAFAAGMMIAAVLFGSVLKIKNKIRTSYLGLWGIGVATTICGLMPATFVGWIIFAGTCAAMGAFGNVHGIPLTAYIQETVAPEKMGRAFSLIGQVTAFTMPIGLLISSPVAEKMGVHMWFLISGLGILLILVILIGIGGLLKKKRSPLT
ncbi:MFS transporter [Emergencia timonensis]|uniref:MFS transporter n=1 Tax=Emergencia timonensis TaxID=1776384 RepID=UPI001D06D717|nr:MFS transporter [Emergencia timonensis]MBS6175372.1 MFS transporter [Clostridiales bacterium]MCB6474650.1 MFS transporter [Emergencia timonensis]